MATDKAVHWANVEHEAPAWFRDAKFGLFFHWGPYSVPAYQNEWYSRNMYAKGLPQSDYHIKTYGRLSEFGYKDFYKSFTGAGFDADQWAELVVRAGARYAGLVTEHADNFSMWNSKVSKNNCVNYGPRRDITGLTAEAFRKRGVKVLATFHHAWNWGWFMSTDNEADVYDPANEKYYGKALPLETNRYLPYRYPDAEFNELWKNKVLEVCEAYRPDALYFDSRTCIIAEEQRYAMAERYYELCPQGVLTYKQADFPLGIGVLDVERGCFAQAQTFPWQTDDRLEDNVTWCIVQEPKYRKAEAIVHQLCDTVSKNGNLLLNIGPCTDGSFHPGAVKEIEAVGDWLRVCGEAIYGTRPFTVAAEGPTMTKDVDYNPDMIKRQIAAGSEANMQANAATSRDFRFTARDGVIYAIALGWPDDGKMLVRTLAQNAARPAVRRVWLLGHGEPLRFTQDARGLSVELPQKKPCGCAYALKIE